MNPKTMQRVASLPCTQIKIGWSMPSLMSWCCTFCRHLSSQHSQTHENANEQLIMPNPHLSWLETPPCEASESQNISECDDCWVCIHAAHRALHSNIDHHRLLSTNQMCDLLANQPKPKLNHKNQLSLRGKITNLKSLWTIIINY